MCTYRMLTNPAHLFYLSNIVLNKVSAHSNGIIDVIHLLQQ